jgi:NHL repeat-containing protein
VNADKQNSSFCEGLKVFRLLAPCTASIVAVLLCAAAPAYGEVSHAFSGTIGAASSTPPNPYPLSNPTDVVFDQVSHDIYVADTGNYRVEKFDSTGHFILMFGKNVDETNGGNVCTAASGDTCKTGTPSSVGGAFEDPTSLAIDNYPGGEGDVYVGDAGDGLVQKFTAAGSLITTWGSNGQKDGSDATTLPEFGPVYGVAVGGGCATPTSPKNGVCSPDGNLYVDGAHYADVRQYTQEGTYIKWDYLGMDTPLRANSEGDLYSAAGPVYKDIPEHGEVSETRRIQMTTESSTTGFGIDSSDQDLYQDVGSQIYHYSDCEPALSGPCAPADSFGSGELSGAQGVEVDDSTHAVYVANSGDNDVVVFNDVRPSVTTGPFTNATESSVTLTGHIDPLGRGNITSCQFEWGFEKNYGHIAPCTPDPSTSNFTEPTDVTTTLTGFSPGTTDHYRLVATNALGATTKGEDRTFITTQPPAIDGLSSAHLTATTADLNAQVNPNGLETSYRFEYGTTISYGQAVPVPDGSLSASNADQPIGVHLENLIPHEVYHYRLIATNADGTTASEDHTFNFYPPPCPNENVRQQTQSNYLPDCRAYELVTPDEAGGTQIFPDGPNTGYASGPPRFAYKGLFSTIPNSGGSPIDGAGDLYVATRAATGWVSRYVGLPANEAAVDGGPPQGPPNSTPGPDFDAPSAVPGASGELGGVLTDPSMSRFLVFNDGNQGIASGNDSDFQNKSVISSDAPYVFNSEGTYLDRWPTNLGSIPEGSYGGLGVTNGAQELLTGAPGGSHALDCPYSADGYGSIAGDACPGDVTASSNLSHFVFASEWNAFAPGGQFSAPGSVYDNNTNTGTVSVASLNPSGEDIPSQPTDLSGDPLQIPGSSSDGSHILMAAGGLGPCGAASCGFPPCGTYFSMVKRCQMQPSNLYMRVDDSVTYDVSRGRDVNYIGMTEDGSKVYFTSSQQLTSEATGSSTELYMWSEAGEKEGRPLTLISKGTNGASNNEVCSADFTTGCDVTTYTQLFYCELGHALGGNCLSDNSIASESGDVYFFSPEQLDGSRGMPNQQNLYVYRNGQVQYVTTLTGPQDCYTVAEPQCTRVERMQVSPNGEYMAFVTSSAVTQYNNAGYQEMYRYDAVTRQLVCVSCIPSGSPPTSNVLASQDGLFMSNDGRTFFSTEDALVQGDTNHSEDVYEYVDGRPQLITPGTGNTLQPNGGVLDYLAAAGLIGVSADGSDVYFGTYQSLVPGDHNGLFFKVYDARSGGGFSSPAPPPPCDAADECHGAGSSAPPSPQGGTKVALGSGGNLSQAPKRRHRRRHHRRTRASLHLEIHRHRKGDAK